LTADHNASSLAFAELRRRGRRHPT
jgi:hypothetical protein